MSKTPQYILDKIERAKRENAETLDLNSSGLTEVPEELLQLPHLVSLNLTYNPISEIPEKITRLQNLTTLVLVYTQITEIPVHITELRQLTTLDLTYNKISNIPDSIVRLRHLTTLSLSYNQLSEIPECLSMLEELTSLFLSDNRISEIPKHLSRLKNLIVLDLEANNLAKIPYHVSLLKNLKVLRVLKNPIIEPPLVIVENGIAAIQSYYRLKSAQGVKRLFEAKLMFIGQPAAGKTSLMKKLLDENYEVPCKEPSTTGITVKTGWRFSCEAAPSGAFSANLWDFGGQEIQYMTHQFFLTSRACYVLVADDRKQNTHFDYWFNILKTLGGASPVLVVLNEKDGNKITNFDYETYRKSFERHFPLDRCEVDLSEKSLKRFHVLREKIQNTLRNLPHVGAELPASWIPIRGELDQQRGEHYIKLEDYFEICRKHGLKRESDQLQLSGYLHDLGVILHFEEDSALRNTVFLNPQWVVNAVYAILESDYAKKNSGRFTRKWMFGLWGKKGYSSEERHNFLSLMLKNNFELCYPLEGAKKETYIAPQLLPATRPKFDWSDENNLHFRFQYPFMPHGVISRLIVRMHEWIEGEGADEAVWVRGAVLQKNGVRALVVQEEMEGLKVINIRLTGPAHLRKEFLGEIRAELRGVHKRNFRNLKVEEMVPIPWRLEVAVELEHLYNLLELGEEKFVPQGLKERVSVFELLEGVSDPRDFESDELRRDERGGLRFAPKIEVNPHIHVSANAESRSQTSAQINFALHLSGLQSSLNELQDEAEELGAPGKELAGELATMQNRVQKLESAKTPEEVKNKGVMNKVRRFLDEVNDASTSAGKTLDKIKGGVKIAQDVAKQYNKIADWCAMPQVPKAFLGE